jgi:Ca2+-binding EF-hand superfamily protein
VVGGGGVGAGGVAGGGFSRPPGAGLPPQISKLMGFDQNKDGRVTADELPENMRGLIKLLDLNGDGAVDLRELRHALRNPAARGRN